MLKGIRILDLSRVLAGPFASMILADMGAEVIKIENPNGGDETRTWGPPFVGKETAYFLSINRNKKSLALNIKHHKGQKVIEKLAEKSDILIENYLPGKLDKMDLGYKQLRKINSRLIYCSITGYGPDGPYAQRGGYDVIASSIGGLNHITGPEDGKPCRVGVAVTDISTGLFAHGAILAALWSREQTGLGQKIDSNLLSTQVAVISHIASNYLNAGAEAKRWGTGHSSIVPYQAFETNDGKFVTVGAGNNRFFGELCQLLDLNHLINDERFISNASRVKNREILIPILAKKFKEKDCDHWLRLFEGCNFPFGPINSVTEALNDPQVLHNGVIMSMDHPTVGQIRVPGPPVHYSGHRYSNVTPPPLLGQHSREVLQDVADLTTKEINDLLAEEVVFENDSYNV